jgi:putative membrane protein
MKEKDILKTIFNFFIIDLIIFALIAFIVALIISIFIEIAFGDIAIRITSSIGFILLLILMWWNYKYRYQNKLGEGDAIELLKLRYAKGDISKEEFEQIKKDISK